jgi:thymidylate synthase (FAD)
MITVEITNFTPYPVQTMVLGWYCTHRHEKLPADPTLADILQFEKDYPEEFKKAWDLVSSSDFQLLESVKFNFRIKNVCVAFREQLVRNRNCGYFIQGNREKVLDHIADDKDYFVPDCIANNPKALEVYERTWKHIQDGYSELLNLGINPGDARLVVGSGSRHTVTFFADYRSLIGLVGKRLCHIAQASLWKDVIKGITDELNKIDPRLVFSMLPQCHKTGVCKFDKINKLRLDTERGLLDRTNGADYSGTHCPRWFELTNQKEN